MDSILIVLTLVEVLLLVLVLAGYLLAITGTLNKIASTAALIRIGVHAIDEQVRPFATILGERDEVAEQNNCPSWQQGHAGLLDIVGLNIYFDNDIPAMLAAARQLFPDKRIVVAETANIYRPDCHPPQRWWAKFEALNEPELEVSWNPGFTMLTHELGERMDGNLLSEDGTQHWQKPELATPEHRSDRV